MRIGRLAVENYRSIPDFDIALPDNAFLIGPTESGKTSLLRLLDLLLGSTVQQVYTSVGISDFTDPSRALTVEVELTDLGDEELAAFPDEVDLTRTPRTVTYRLEVEGDPDTVGELRARRWFPTSGHDRSANRDQTKAFAWYYVPADRSLFRDLGGTRSGALRRLLAALELNDSEALESGLQGLREALQGQDSVIGFKASLAESLSSALPRSVSPSDIQILLRGDLEGELLGSVDVALRGRRRGDRALIHEQSDGILALAAIAIHAMSLTGHGIFAVDEPESHLHPTAQRSVGRLLMSMPGQALVATHSAHVAGQADPTHIVALDIRGAPRMLSAASPLATPAYSDRWWRSDLIDVLTSRCVAVVEGVSDRLLLERAAKAHRIALDRGGIAVLQLGGAGTFEHAHAVIGPIGFSLRWRALGDEDYRDKWAKVVGEADPTKLEALGFTFSDADLEEEYVRALSHRRVVMMLLRSGAISKRRILGKSGRGSLADLTHDDVVGVCRAYKTEAALAVAHLASDAEIRSVDSLARFLRRLPS